MVQIESKRKKRAYGRVIGGRREGARLGLALARLPWVVEAEDVVFAENDAVAGA